MNSLGYLLLYEKMIMTGELERLVRVSIVTCMSGYRRGFGLVIGFIEIVENVTYK
jgi:hypothetical protein